MPGGPDGKSRRYAYLGAWVARFFDHYFVDGAGVDGASVSDCPSFVKEVVPPTESDASLIAAPASFNHVEVKLLQTLPPQPCGAIYKGPELAKTFTPVTGFYGYGARTAQIAAFIDSAGHAIRTEVWQSSGVPGVDAVALAAVQGTTYEPAQFLCTPVVSIAIFSITYEEHKGQPKVDQWNAPAACGFTHTMRSHCVGNSEDRRDVIRARHFTDFNDGVRRRLR